MESKPLTGCSFPSSGHTLFRDEYGTLFETTWNTAGDGKLDITTVMRQPYVWGEQPSGPFFRNGVLFRRGVITTTRQLIAAHPSGYEIVSEGSEQVVGEYQDNFPCEAQPTDPFCYHLDSQVDDQMEIRVTQGPRYADPDAPDNVTQGPTEGAITWGNIQWTDVWGN